MATVMAAVVVPTSAVSASTTINFNLVGAEYAANFGESSLAGVAASTSRTELGVWNAVVPHDLGAIVGGTFTFASKAHSFDAVIAGGTFQARAGATCATTFDIAGTLSGGGSFAMTLTRFGYMTGGRCVVYFAPVRGSASLLF